MCEPHDIADILLNLVLIAYLLHDTPIYIKWCKAKINKLLKKGNNKW